MSKTVAGRCSTKQLFTESLETVEKYLRLSFSKFSGCTQKNNSYCSGTPLSSGFLILKLVTEGTTESVQGGF